MLSLRQHHALYFEHSRKLFRRGIALLSHPHLSWVHQIAVCLGHRWVLLLHITCVYCHQRDGLPWSWQTQWVAWSAWNTQQTLSSPSLQDPSSYQKATDAQVVLGVPISNQIVEWLLHLVRSSWYPYWLQCLWSWQHQNSWVSMRWEYSILLICLQRWVPIVQRFHHFVLRSWFLLQLVCCNHRRVCKGFWL